MSRSPSTANRASPAASPSRMEFPRPTCRCLPPSVAILGTSFYRRPAPSLNGTAATESPDCRPANIWSSSFRGSRPIRIGCARTPNGARRSHHPRHARSSSPRSTPARPAWPSAETVTVFEGVPVDGIDTWLMPGERHSISGRIVWPENTTVENIVIEYANLTAQRSGLWTSARARRPVQDLQRPARHGRPARPRGFESRPARRSRHDRGQRG